MIKASFIRRLVVFGAIGANAGTLASMPKVQADPTDATQEQPATQPAERSRDDDDPLAIFRAPLLREGSHLVDAQATIERDAAGQWKLVLERERPDAPGRDLILLPCTRLSEMQRLVEAAAERILRFQVRGQVFVYRGRNYILPRHAVLVMDEQVTEPATAPAATAPATQPSDSSSPSSSTTAPSTSRSGGEAVQDIIADLRRGAGPIVRSTSNAAVPGTEPKPATSADGPASSPDNLLRESTVIVARRGRLSRDAGGGWLFTFDADASGLADPPVRVLPCLMLERMEEYAGQLGPSAAMLLSGEIFIYNGQNYLMPTLFRVPQDRRNLMP